MCELVGAESIEGKTLADITENRVVAWIGLMRKQSNESFRIVA
jgi:hypothetical protein